MSLEDICEKQVAFSALDWGFGHVSRSISILKKLQMQRCSITIFAPKNQQAVFENYLKNITFIEVQNTPWNFTSKTKIGHIFALRVALKKRFNFIKKAIQSSNFVFDLYLSDHDYAFFKPGKPSVFLTHQRRLPLVSLHPAQWIHSFYLRHFTSCLILDSKHDSERIFSPFSNTKQNDFYIGFQSRFKGLSHVEIPIEKGFYLGVVSGPGPSNQAFFDQLILLAEKSKILLHVSVPSHLLGDSPFIKRTSNWLEGDEWFMKAEVVFSRNGYTTLMDLQVTNKRAILLATKNQVEQQFLAKKDNLKNISQFHNEVDFESEFSAYFSSKIKVT